MVNQNASPKSETVYIVASLYSPTFRAGIMVIQYGPPLLVIQNGPPLLVIQYGPPLLVIQNGPPFLVIQNGEPAIKRDTWLEGSCFLTRCHALLPL